MSLRSGANLARSRFPQGFGKGKKTKLALFAISAAAFLLGCSKDDIAINGDDVFCKLSTGQCNKMKPDACLELGGTKVDQCQSGGDISGDGGLCSIGDKRAVCQWDTGCFFIDSGFEGKPCADIVANCSAHGKLFTAASLSVPDRDMHVENNGLQCASIGGTEVAGGSIGGGKSSSSGGGETIDFCNHNGKRVFCEWPDGCFEQSSTYDSQGRTCSVIISDCFANGKVFSGVNSSKLTPDNEYGKGLKCADIGGTRVTSDGSIGVTGDEGGHCKYNGRVFFCQYEPWQGEPGGCFASSYEYSPQNGTCQVQYNRCVADGKIYYNVDNSLLNEDNGFGSGLRCSDLGGTLN
ncbi:MAG: hypothetical protein LBH25_08320 [Fibromonadaceae bacterium]|nr:hypothetical protein [Fibromonadaceae bacterium]